MNAAAAALVIIALATQSRLCSAFVVPRTAINGRTIFTTNNVPTIGPSGAVTPQAPVRASTDSLDQATPTAPSSGDPKDQLVSLIVQGLKDAERKVSNEIDPKKIDSLIEQLRNKYRGFEADLVDGEWALVFQKQGDKSPKIQKAVGKGERAGYSMNIFDVKELTFDGDVRLLRNKLVVKSTVKYSPTTEAYDKNDDGKIVLRRIKCDIIDASIKLWRLPKIPLPLRAKGGFLEFVYMDEDIRITTGNRGGLFVHFRPEFLDKQLA